MNDQTTWEQRVNKLKENFGFSLGFDLVKDFQALHLYTDRRDLMRKEKESLKMQTEKNHKEICNLEKASELLIANQEIVNNIKIAIEKTSSDMRWSIHTPQRYSKIKTYIARLCGIFHEGTGIFPEVTSPKAKGQTPYRGKFYEFLLEAKPLLAEIGTELVADDMTIGKYALQIVNGVKKEGIISFAELQKEIEIEKLLK